MPPSLSLEDFKSRMLDRFRQPAKSIAERELVRILDDGVFKECSCRNMESNFA